MVEITAQNNNNNNNNNNNKTHKKVSQLGKSTQFQTFHLR